MPDSETTIVRRVLLEKGRIDTIDAFEQYRITRLALPIDRLRKSGMAINCEKHGGREGKALYVLVHDAWTPERTDTTYPPMVCKECGERSRLTNIQPTVDPRWYFVFCGVCDTKRIAQVLAPAVG